MNESIVLLGLATTPLELTASVLAVITVVLNIRQTHWAWLFAIISSAVYGIVFLNARLYGDMCLQGVFIAVSVWGWYQWLYGGEQHSPLVATRSSLIGWIGGIAGWLVLYAVIGYALHRYTDSHVWRIDGFLTAGSLLGQLLLSRKKVENWLVWIVVDVLYVGLYIHQNLHVTAVLYAAFVVMAWFGWRAWVRIADGKL
ncbi:nicotinamide riboside transporter PnuC [Massilia pseudoviolaceinigra]|uniref:nicotinamide riboside transporter PnuC n=1 Tax=Massilia pseudoviolaceinigra TaxID=3057165 RepID=UPI0027964E15|nr:nicotinamide riboside transporter PnuC [Massilia sp. CCM 9206]MDQ1918974.1 nicotinamide riboside transporter PnuC [Massilia sp. CCM 9206]